MPKLTRNFLKGRMNKDVDLRLVPAGEYRDAANIQVSTSEAQDAGAIESVFGNTKIQSKTGGGNWDNNYGAGGPVTVIGSARDTQNNKIYFFITRSDLDAIIEYDKATGHIAPIIIDSRGGSSVLNFNTNNVITAANVVEGVLFFTDNLNEPRRINIERFKTATTTTVSTATTFIGKTTHIYGATRDFLADDITVIKKAPLNALTINAGSSKHSTSSDLNPAGTILNPVTSVKNLGNAAAGETFLGGGLTLSSAVNWHSLTPEPFVTLNASKTLSDESVEKYRIVAQLNAAAANDATTITLDVKEVSDDIPDENLTWEIAVVEESAIFKNNFPRFSYRYKFNDGEYSPFAPFSLPAFAVGKFKYESEEGYNKAMQNNIRKVFLRGFATTPADVDKVEVLYKGSNSENVYIIHEFNYNFSADPQPTLSLDLDSENIGRVVPSNQLLRLFDAVPKKALAQEIIGNRIVYGNYTENYDLTTDDFTLTADQTNTTISGSDPIGEPTVKSDREYTVGISWLDGQLRESPVFVYDSSSITVSKRNADKKNTLKARIDPATVESLYAGPSWATYYKFYIKESKAPYYNLGLDRYYDAEDGNAWLSFPSSEINKVREGQNIILKKEHDSSAAVTEDNEFRILSISQSVPEYLNNKHEATAIGICANDNFSDAVGFVQGENVITFFGPANDITLNANENSSAGFATAIKSGNKLEFRDKNGFGGTKLYEIRSGGLTGENESIKVDGSTTGVRYAKYEITLQEGISDAWLSNLSYTLAGGTRSATDDDRDSFKIVIHERKFRPLPEFDGRFFVKIPKTEALVNKISKAFKETTEQIEDTSFPISATNQTVEGFEGDFDADNDVFNNSTHILWKDLDASAVAATTGLPDGVTNLPGDTFQLYWVDSTGDQANQPNSKTVKFLHKFVPGVYFKFKYLDNTTSSRFYKLINREKIATYDRTTGDAETNSSDQGEGAVYKYTMDVARLDTQAADHTHSGTQYKGGNIKSIVLFKEKDLSNVTQLTSTNPAVFETEPQDIADVDLFYEASSPIAKSSITSFVNLNFFNAYSFGNGVESNRINDDFNAPFIKNGVRVNAKIDEQFKETVRSSSLTFSGILNNITKINNSNQFLTSEDIFKDLNPTYGSVQKLHARNSDLIALCEDKVVRILANKDALFEADGRPALTATPNVLGQAVPFAGEYGISKNPESFASYGFRAYFADKARRAVLRLSADGLTVISDKGMRDFFSEHWDDSGVPAKLCGSFDERNEVYNIVTDTNEQVSFSEAVNGWPTRLSYQPEFSGVSLDNQFFTFKSGYMWIHDNTTKNTFYGVASVNSSVNIVFNDLPSNPKMFKTLSYDGVTGWDAAVTMQPSSQTGSVTDWVEKEGIYYNYIKGTSSSAKDFNTQGIGAPNATISSGAITFANPVNVNVQVGDAIYKNGSLTSATVSAIAADRLSITPSSTVACDANDFIYVVKPVGLFTNGLIGTTAQVLMTKSGNTTGNNELFSVSAEIFISSE